MSNVIELKGNSSEGVDRPVVTSLLAGMRGFTDGEALFYHIPLDLSTNAKIRTIFGQAFSFVTLYQKGIVRKNMERKNAGMLRTGDLFFIHSFKPDFIEWTINQKRGSLHPAILSSVFDLLAFRYDIARDYITTRYIPELKGKWKDFMRSLYFDFFTSNRYLFLNVTEFNMIKDRYIVSIPALCEFGEEVKTTLRLDIVLNTFSAVYKEIISGNKLQSVILSKVFDKNLSDAPLTLEIGFLFSSVLYTKENVIVFEEGIYPNAIEPIVEKILNS